MKHGIDYHGALAPLNEACRLADADILCVSDLMQTGSTQDSIARKAALAWKHLRFAWTVFRNRRRQGILVRDFSNVPLALVFPLIFWKKDRIWFVVNHNLQWTLGSRVERRAFCRLGRWGCRFIFFEQVPVERLEEYGVDPRHSVALLHPVPEPRVKRNRTGGVETVGIIGQFRPEKGVDELLAQLAPLAASYRIVLALPNIGTFRELSRFAAADWFDVVDSGGTENYLKAIAECDVVLLNHPSQGYEFRVSGLLADAAVAHVPVVVRNLPALRCQTLQPVAIGECFDDLSEIPSCIEQVSKKLANDGYDFSSYLKSRSAREWARQLDRICNAM